MAQHTSQSARDDKANLALNMRLEKESVALETRLKEEKRALMPPVDEKTRKSRNWLLRLVGAR